MIFETISVPKFSTLLVPLAFIAGSMKEKPKEEFCIDDNNLVIEKKIVEKQLIVDSSLIHALINVESRGNAKCIGDTHLGEPSIGVLQIRPIMVREVNRILKIQDSTLRYKRKDRYSRTKSIEMFVIWRDFHHRGASDETISKCWNGGPNGRKLIKTQHYWNKVQKELKEIRG